jgi:hypothetical protein
MHNGRKIDLNGTTKLGRLPRYREESAGNRKSSIFLVGMGCEKNFIFKSLFAMAVLRMFSAANVVVAVLV